MDTNLLHYAALKLYSYASEDLKEEVKEETEGSEEITPTQELGSKIEPVIITDPKTEKEKKMFRVQQEGKRIGKASWQLNDEFVLGNRYRKLQFVPQVVPYNKVDMRSGKAKMQIVDAVLEIIATDDYFAPLRGNVPMTKNLILNLIGMKTAEGSSANYNIGNIQVGYGKLGQPNKYWRRVFLMGDKTYSGGATIPYIELWRSYENLKDGVKDWIDLLKSRGMLAGALKTPLDFYTYLRTKGYFGTKMSKNVIPKHEKAYVGGIEAGRKRNKDMIDKKIEEFYRV